MHLDHLNMHLLNEKYYQKLISKFGKTENELEIVDTNFIKINTSFLEISLTKKRLNLLLQIPASYQNMDNLYTSLLLRLINIQFLEADSEPDYIIGMTLKKLNDQKEFELIEINGNTYRLMENIKGKKKENYFPCIDTISYENLKNKYIILKNKRGTRRNRLESIRILFDKLYKVDFIPNRFKSKSIVVCKKSIWNSLSNIEIFGKKLKSCISCIYITKKGSEQSTVNIDPVLYFVPDYSTAFQFVLRKRIKIDNIIVLDCKSNQLQLPTMISDQREYNFQICAITTQNYEVEGFNTWRWHKEEIDLIDSL